MSLTSPLLPYHDISTRNPQSSQHSAAEPRSTHPTSMPPHWRRVNDFTGVRPSFMQPVLQEIFKTMCMIAFARATLDHQWRVLTGNEKDFKEDKERINKMIQAWTLFGSLLLASTAALVTTPPPTPKIINYTQRGTYHCLWISFGLMLGGIVAGSIIQVSLSSSTQGYVRYTLMATRYRIWALLIVLSYPSLTIILGSGLNTFGLLVAGWNSEDSLAKVSCSILLSLPIGLLALVLSARKENKDHAKGEVRPPGPVPVHAESYDAVISSRTSESAARLALAGRLTQPRRSRSV